MAMTSGIMVTPGMHSRTWHGKELSLDEFLVLIKGVGLETVDIFLDMLEHVDLHSLAKHIKAHDLKTACFYINADLVSDDPDKVKEADENFKRGIGAAQTLGAPICFTHGSQHTHQGPEAFQKYTERLDEKLELFAGTGTTLVIENAGKLLHTAEDMVRITDVLANLRLCLDTGNFYLWGQDEVDAARMMLPRTVHFHIKDYAQRWEGNGDPRADDCELGKGRVRNEEIINFLKGKCWQGVLAWEPAGQPEDEFEASVKRLLDWMA